MAGSSFADGLFQSHFVDLDQVNRRLLCDPNPRTRDSSTIRLDTTSESLPRLHLSLGHAKRCAETSAKLLAGYHEGRALLNSEDPCEHLADPSYWYAKACYYRDEHHKLLDKKEDQRDSTPEVAMQCDWHNELERAKGSANNIARALARLPAGKALLEAESHDETINDPAYWWKKKRQYEAEYRKTEIEHARRSANEAALALAHFPAAKDFLEAENQLHSTDDPEYWWMKEELYRAEHKKLWQEYWDHWKCVHLEQGRMSVQPLNPLGKARSSRRTVRYKTRSTTCGVGAKHQNELEGSSPPCFLQLSTTGISYGGHHRTSKSKVSNGAATNHLKLRQTIPLPNIPTSRAEQHRKRKRAVQKKSLRDVDMAYSGSRGRADFIEPISSRLRSSHQIRAGNSSIA